MLRRITDILDQRIPLDSPMSRLLTIALLALTLLAGCVFSRTDQPNRPAPMFTSKAAAASKNTQRNAADNGMDPIELQAALMSFADTTSTRMSEVSEMIEAIGTPQARLTAARMMVFNLASDVEMAAGPYPGVALLDMIVVNSLRRMVWEDFWIPKVFGEQAKPALTVFREVEGEIWGLAARIMTGEQMDELARVILAWRKKNPDKVSVNYVRFDDFGDLGLKPSMRQLANPGGLFASVEKAALVAQDMKVAIDRAFYLISRMQILINFQIKLAYLEIMFQPESNGIISTTEQMVGVTERYAEIAEKLPKELGTQASTLLNQMFANLNVQREATINQALEGLTQLQGETISDVMAGVSKEREAALNQALMGLEQEQRMLFEQMSELVIQSQSNLEATLNHGFLLGLLLLLAFFTGLTLYRFLVARRTKT